MYMPRVGLKLASEIEEERYSIPSYRVHIKHVDREEALNIIFLEGFNIKLVKDAQMRLLTTGLQRGLLKKLTFSFLCRWP